MVGMLRMRGRRVTAWLLSFPLMVVGSQVAHVFAYRWVYPNAHVRLSELVATGHGYMGSPSYAPMLLGFVFAAELVAAGCVLVSALRRSRQRAVPAWAFALLPMLGFTLQEFIERWLSGSPFPWWMVLQPTYRVGLLLQLPFALVAYVVARLLLRAADRVGRILRGAIARPAPRSVSLRWVVLEVDSPRRGAVDGGHSGRGPPRGLAAVSALAS
jgi:hypothetical protein